MDDKFLVEKTIYCERKFLCIMLKQLFRCISIIISHSSYFNLKICAAWWLDMCKNESIWWKRIVCYYTTIFQMKNKLKFLKLTQMNQNNIAFVSWKWFQCPFQAAEPQWLKLSSKKFSLFFLLLNFVRNKENENVLKHTNSKYSFYSE